MLVPRNAPCGTCPYRRDCPSGLWDKSEYAKLQAYDAETFNQPPLVFMCHDKSDGQTLCRGWLDCHSKEDSLSLRLAASAGRVSLEIFTLPASDIPVFESGHEAATHGLRDIDEPNARAVKMIRKLASSRDSIEDHFE